MKKLTTFDQMVGRWLQVIYVYSEMKDLASKAKVAREWAQTVAIERPTVPQIGWSDCPQGLTPRQAEEIRSFTSLGYTAGWYLDRTDLQQKPSEYLDKDFLRQYPGASLDRDEILGKYPDALEQLVQNRELVTLIDECFEIGRHTAIRSRVLQA